MSRHSSVSRLVSCAFTGSLLSVALSLAACGNQSSSTNAPAASSSDSAPVANTATGKADGNAILIVASSSKDKAALNTENDTAYPLLQSGAVETLVTTTLDGKAEPALATTWRRTSDTSWEFDLRPNVKFHDGTMLDADAVATSLNYVMKAATPPRALKGSGLTAEVIDTDTVKLTTAKADPVLPLRLSGPNTAILAKAAYATTPMNPIGFGSGPYKITQYDPGASGLTLARFDEYWGGRPKLDGVQIRSIVDADARFNALKVGEVHIASAIAPGNFLEAQKNSALRTDKLALPRSSTLYTNVSKGILKNLKIRQAIDLLIDREAIATAVLEGTATPAAGYFSSVVPWASKATARPADYLDQAKKLITESGVKPEELKLNLMTYALRPELSAAANVIKSNLEQAGFSITIDIVDYSTVLEPKMLAKEHELVLLSRSFYTDMVDLGSYFASDFGCEGSYNLNAFCDKAFDAIWQEGISKEKAEERNALFAKAAQYLIDNKIGIPVYHDTSRRVFSTQVQNAVHDPLDQHLVTHTTSLPL